MGRTCTVSSLVGILVAAASADVVLVEDRFSVDVLAWVNCAWRQAEVAGYADTRFDFYRRGALVGIEGRTGTVALGRVSMDAANLTPLDVYADFHWPSGFGLRAGQFVAPVGFEALTDPKALRFIEYSLVKNAWKPLDPRDVGLMGTYKNAFAELAVAVVNGNGRGGWLQDDNKWKDVCGQVVFKSFDGLGVLLALRAYYGRTGTEGSDFTNYALELDARRGPLEARCELQNAVIGPTTFTSFYAQASHRLLAALEPVARFQMSFGTGSVRNIGITGGLNSPIRGDDLKVMIDYDYRRQDAPGIESDFTVHQILLQLQTAF
jgi:hypothetical protein